MSTRHPRRIEREATALLKKSGLPFEFKEGKKHIKLYIENALACVLTKNARGGDTLLIQTIIKRKLNQ